MLAKPEYFSPPNEVCCWPGRCGGATAERRLRSEDAGGSVAESYREETASRESHREEYAGGGRRSEDDGGSVAVIHREETVARESHREEYAGGETAEEWPERKREKALKQEY